MASVVAAFALGFSIPDGTIAGNDSAPLSSTIDKAVTSELARPPLSEAEFRRRVDELESLHPSGSLWSMRTDGGDRLLQRVMIRLIVVYCGTALQLDRLVRRGGMTLEEAKARIASQMPVEEKLKLAHYRSTRRELWAAHVIKSRNYRDLVLSRSAAVRGRSNDRLPCRLPARPAARKSLW